MDKYDEAMSEFFHMVPGVTIFKSTKSVEDVSSWGRRIVAEETASLRSQLETANKEVEFQKTQAERWNKAFQAETLARSRGIELSDLKITSLTRELAKAELWNIDMEKKLEKSEADNARMREALRNLMEICYGRYPGMTNSPQMLAASSVMDEDSGWLERHDAETRRKAFEEVYKKMGDTPANVYFNFVDWVRSQIKALELQGVDKE